MTSGMLIQSAFARNVARGLEGWNTFDTDKNQTGTDNKLTKRHSNEFLRFLSVNFSGWCPSQNSSMCPGEYHGSTVEGPLRMVNRRIGRA